MSHHTIHSLPFSTRALRGGAKNLIKHDRARAQKLLGGVPNGPQLKLFANTPQNAASPTNTTSVNVTDASVTYVMDVSVGSPGTTHRLLIDTGSSNTWIGAHSRYKHTQTTEDTRMKFTVSYGSGKVTGEEFLDTVSLGSLKITNQSIGVASSAQGFTGVDGILGIGPTDLTIGTLSDKTQPVPTVLDNLFAQKSIPTSSLGISYVPTTSTEELPNGELTFGGTDHARYSGDLNYVPVTSTDPASRYWGIDQTVTYGDDTPIITSSGITDTGTTLLLLASDAFQKYQEATGAVLDETTGLLTVTDDQYGQMQSLWFEIGGQKYEFTKNAQIWPRSLNSMLGGEEGKIYLVTSDLGEIGSGGLDFINGFSWLQRYYTVYDWSGEGRIGIAPTEHTFDETN
ncbi:acid protease [Flagelloscypha sp. PMI_526]|nr:acid protease [Flagelloscypha sp. PMI_526]